MLKQTSIRSQDNQKLKDIAKIRYDDTMFWTLFNHPDHCAYVVKQVIRVGRSKMA